MHDTILPGEAKHHAAIMEAVGALMHQTTLCHILDALAEHCSDQGDKWGNDSPAGTSWDNCAGLLLNTSFKIKEGV